MSFSDTFRNLEIAEHKVGVIWIGQAGFLLKTAGGRKILIDPYLTDSVYHIMEKEEGLGYKRLSVPLFEPNEVIPDFLLISHEHPDHLDMETMPVYRDQENLQVITNTGCKEQLVEAGFPENRIHALRKGEEVSCGEFWVKAVDCDHGELCPDALGFLLDFGFVKLYYSGDTGYTPERLREAVMERPDVALLPINGAYGNLNGTQAARLAADLEVTACIPHHFWTFPRHLGNPIEAVGAFRELAPGCRLDMDMPGRVFLYPCGEEPEERSIHG